MKRRKREVHGTADIGRGVEQGAVEWRECAREGSVVSLAFSYQSNIALINRDLICIFLIYVPTLEASSTSWKSSKLRQTKETRQ